MYDDEGNELSTSIRTVQSEWITDGFVPFKSIMDFEKPKNNFGTLALKKNNSSRIEEFDSNFEIPVRFR